MSGAHKNIHLEIDKLINVFRSDSSAATSLTPRARQVVETATRVGNVGIETRAVLLLADLLAEAGDDDTALGHYEQAEGLAVRARSNDFQVQALRGCSVQLTRLGRYEEAVQVCTRGIGLVERDRYTVSAPYTQGSYLRGRFELYQKGVEAAHATGQGDLALRWIELSRGRGLSLIGNRRGSPAADEVRRQLRVLGGADIGADDLVSQRGTGARRRLFDKLIKTYRVDEPPPAPSEADVRDKLADGECVVSWYWLSNDMLLVTGFRRDQCVSKRITIPPNALRHLQRIVKASGGTGPGTGLLDDTRSILHPLLLPEPIAGWVLAADRLIVAAHRELHALPLLALAVGDHYVLENASICAVPSLGRFCEPAPPASGPSVSAAQISYPGFGFPDLPLSEAEARRVGEIYGVDALVDQELTGAALDTVLASGSKPPRVVHLAVHGQSVGEEYPLESSLYLARTRLDGIDVAGWDLTGTTVFLSACMSGQRSHRTRGMSAPPGDDILGLPAVFFYAGASQVVGLLWPVHDDTALAVSTEFHRRFAAGEPGDIALSHAVRSYVEESRKRDFPRYWASFLLTTNTTPHAKGETDERS